MKAFLMYKDSDFDLQRKLPSNEYELMKDLELLTLFNAMAAGDKFLLEVAREAVLSGLYNDLDAIFYRQSILKDCLKNPSVVRDIYHIAVEAVDRRKTHCLGFLGKYPASRLYMSIEMLKIFVEVLKNLRNITDKHSDIFESEGFKAFFAMLKQELNDEFFTRVQEHLRELKFHDGILISAELGKGNKGANYILRKPSEKKQSWMQRILAKKTPVYTFTISEHDESGARALSGLKDQGIVLVANELARSADHIYSFFNRLRHELAFYVGCLNLHERLDQQGEPMSFPIPAAPGQYLHSFKGLYDVCLALSMEPRVVGNDLNLDDKVLTIITGANQGGKSTFLRSIGLAQLMMQCGMFVPAEFFCSSICDCLFTHYKREEDTTMNSGKLDEELSRMSSIVDNITSNSMLLFNESFAATNEREGSEIARQIIGALLEKNIRVFFVTHLFDFANKLYKRNLERVIFLRAERKSGGERTFRIIKGEPLQSAFGGDLYIKIFEADELI